MVDGPKLEFVGKGVVGRVVNVLDREGPADGNVGDFRKLKEGTAVYDDCAPLDRIAGVLYGRVGRVFNGFVEVGEGELMLLASHLKSDVDHEDALRRDEDLEVELLGVERLQIAC